MRVAWKIAVGTLVSASAAFAQIDWLENPWLVHAQKAGHAQKGSAPLAQVMPPEASAEPGLAAANGATQTTSWVPEHPVDVMNPWVRQTDPRSAPAVELRPAAAAARARSWARPVEVIVDPWPSSEAKSWASEIDLLVDPWSDAG